MIPHAAIIERRERVFLVTTGLFLCAMALVRVIGITRFIQIGPLALAFTVSTCSRQRQQ